MLKKIYIWDLPTRIFHWLLVVSVAAAFITVQLGGNYMIWHGRLGVFIIGLITFRLIWGFVGRTPSRFSHFVRGPQAIIQYIRHPHQSIGHNPLGALSVLTFIILLIIQAGTGLFANDDISFTGPLFRLVTQDMSETLTSLHRLTINFLIALIILHVLSIVFYAVKKKNNLLPPMITGWKTDPPPEFSVKKESLHGGGFIAFVVTLLIAGSLVWGISSGTLAEQISPLPTQQAPAPAPAW